MISVCMTTYNGELYLKEQIESILQNLSKQDELIISDDGSSDGTLSIIKSFADERIKLFHHNKNNCSYRFKYSYTTANVSNALSFAKGDVIFLADQDDVWTKDKVSKMLPLLEQYDLVLSDCYNVDSKLQILYNSHFELTNTSTSIIKNIYKSSFLGCCMCFKRGLLTKILPIPVNTPHDLWIGCIVAYFGTIGLLHDKTLLYRRHDNNVSSTNKKLITKQNDGAVELNKNTNSTLFKLTYRFIFLKEFLKRCITYQKK